MAGIKTGISALYAHARDRPYTAVYTKQGRTDMGLRSSKKLRAIESGNKKLRWIKTHRVALCMAQPSTIHDKLLERLRQRAVRKLNVITTKEEYMVRFPIIAHQILRNHPLAQGAGADRVSKGMSKAFGKGFSLAARMKPGQPLMIVYLHKSTHLGVVQSMMKSFNPCIPGKTQLRVTKGKG